MLDEDLQGVAGADLGSLGGVCLACRDFDGQVALAHRDDESVGRSRIARVGRPRVPEAELLGTLFHGLERELGLAGGADQRTFRGDVHRLAELLEDGRLLHALGRPHVAAAGTVAVQEHLQPVADLEMDCRWHRRRGDLHGLRCGCRRGTAAGRRRRRRARAARARTAAGGEPECEHQRRRDEDEYGCLAFHDPPPFALDPLGPGRPGASRRRGTAPHELQHDVCTLNRRRRPST